MKVLMYGWEFPPHNQGGLGVACKGIVDGLLGHDIGVHLVLPYHDSAIHSEQFEVSKGLDRPELSNKYFIQTKVDSLLHAYQTPENYGEKYEEIRLNATNQHVHSSSNADNKKVYGQDLFHEVHRYKFEAGTLASEVDHDVIHAHDWMTYPAAVHAKQESAKPLVLHIHATEMDRTGGNPHPTVYHIEKMGFEYADKIIAVSQLTKQKLVKHYLIDPSKIEVVHNAVAQEFCDLQTKRIHEHQKTVLFLGRMTLQKGPDYFIRAAKRVLEVEPDVNFMMAGDGDMMGHIIQETIALGIHEHFIFTGFLRGDDIDRAFQSADLFVMPSVSEPFGLVALESIRNGTPVLMSKQSGSAEVLPNALKVDFWDIDAMANKMVVALRENVLRETLSQEAHRDFSALTWENQTHKIKSIYHSVV